MAGRLISTRSKMVRSTRTEASIAPAAQGDAGRNLWLWQAEKGPANALLGAGSLEMLACCHDADRITGRRTSNNKEWPTAVAFAPYTGRSGSAASPTEPDLPPDVCGRQAAIASAAAAANTAAEAAAAAASVAAGAAASMTSSTHWDGAGDRRHFGV